MSEQWCLWGCSAWPAGTRCWLRRRVGAGGNDPSTLLPRLLGVRGPLDPASLDLSLRFGGEAAGRDLIGIEPPERTSGGLAVVGIIVWFGGEIVAVDVCSSMLDPRHPASQ